MTTLRETISRNVYMVLAAVMVGVLVFFAFISNSTTEYRKLGRRGNYIIPTRTDCQQLAADATTAASPSSLYLQVRSSGCVHHQRAALLQHLLLANHWGIQNVVIGDVELHRPEKQPTDAAQHRPFKPPYDHVESALGAAKSTGNVSGLFNIKSIQDAASQLNIQFQHVDTSRQFAATITVATGTTTWDDLLDLKVLPPVMSSSGVPRAVQAVVSDPFALARNMSDCRRSPHCGLLALSLAAPDTMSKTLIAPLLQGTSSTYVAVYVGGNCSFDTVERIVLNATEGLGASSLYVVSSTPVTQQRKKVGTMDIITRRTVFDDSDFPSEVLKEVDFEMARRAPRFISVGVVAADILLQSLELYRRLDGGAATIVTEGC